ncbi:MAG: regulatory protein RecX, partial [Candidatus Rokuibacteriota bacterium]
MADPGRAPRRPLDLAAARLAAADLLSRRPWTQAELGRRLLRRGAPADIADQVVVDFADRG